MLRTRLALLAIPLLHPAGAAAQRSASAPLDDFIVDVWTTEQGLPQNSVNALAQTPEGYLWLGTFGGLVRFDGVRFTLLPRRDSTGVHLDRIHQLSAAPDSSVWIGTERGLLRFRHGRYESWPLPPDVPGLAIVQLHASPDGSVWFVAGSRLMRLRDGRIETIAEPAGGALRQDGSGVLWVGYASSGGFGIGQDGQRIAYPAGAENFHRDEIGDDGVRESWFAMRDGGLARYAGDGTPRWRSGPLPGAFPHHVARDGAGDYWIGTVRSGLHLFRPGGGGSAPATWFLPMPGRSGYYDLRATLVDAEGTLWAGTNGDGLMRVRRRLIRVYAGGDGFREEAMTTLMQDRSGRMLLGTNCGGLYQLRPGEHMVERFPWPPGGPQPSCVVSLAEDHEGAIWIGGYTPLLRVRNGRTEIVNGAAGERISGAHALHVAPDSTVWAGLLGGGLVAFPPEGRGPPRRYGPAQGLRDPDVRFVTSDPDGTVWVGTTGGAGRLVGERFQWFTTADGLPADFVRVVHRTADGAHWIGTYGGGLARLRDGRFVAIRREHGLSDDVVSSLLEDDAGNFWMTGNRGIFRARRADLDAFADGAAGSVHSILYTRADGLLNAETNGGFSPAAWRARNGTLWFPTLRGVAVIDPARADLTGQPPTAILEEVLVDREPVPLDGEPRVGPGRRNLEVHYTGLSLASPEHIVFRYRLHGFEDRWDVVGPRRQAYYPRLPPGRYRFEVQAANRDGEWGMLAALPIHVVPFMWETGWFQLLALAGLVSAASLGVRRRMEGLRRKQEAQRAFSRRFMEGQETERRRLASELHDSIGQGLLVAKNRAALALRAPEVQPELRAHLDEIVGVVSETLEEARNISHALRPHELDRLGLAAAVRGAVQHAAASSGMRISADVDAADGALTKDAEIAVFRIVQEALSNVLKHSAAATAHVAITRAASGVKLAISDDGRGFDDSRSAGFGLSGIRERAELIGGTCAIRGVPGEGTTVVVTVPERPAATG